ncbi:unnamed protein product, partial [Effrenium voratum]
EPGLECALWPCLFWRLDQTFSNERATDPRRQRGETLEEALRPAARLEAGEEEGAGEAEAEEEDGLVRHSIKRLYGALALGCLLGYTEHFEILQQVGFPKFFWTLAPSEWTLPYHEFIKDGVAKALRDTGARGVST